MMILYVKIISWHEGGNFILNLQELQPNTQYMLYIASTPYRLAIQLFHTTLQ